MTRTLTDTHIHVWDFQQADYPWLKGDTSILNRSYALDELEQERQQAGITAGILVQAANNLEDTGWMLQTAARHPWIKGIVGWLPLQDPEAAARILEKHYYPGSLLKGVRHLIHDEPDTRWLLQDTVLESLGLLAGLGIPYDLVGVLPAHIETALKVAEKWPALRMVFDHLNQPPIGRIDKQWESLMITAARHDRFHVKISGLGTAAKRGQDWTAADIEPAIEFALRHFGEDRCFCGGDWPVSLLAGSYVKTWTAYCHAFEKLLGRKGREKPYHLNAERFYCLSGADHRPQ